MTSPLRSLSLAKSKIGRAWDPLIVSQGNNVDFRLVRIEGSFIWHKHDDCDETFILIDGEFGIAFRDQIVELRLGDLVTVPRGVEHRPFSPSIGWVYVIEPQGTVNTGDQVGELTQRNLATY